MLLRPVGDGGAMAHPQILTDQLTLFQPRGTDYAPIWIFRPSYGPAWNWNALVPAISRGSLYKWKG